MPRKTCTLSLRTPLTRPAVVSTTAPSRTEASAVARSGKAKQPARAPPKIADPPSREDLRRDRRPICVLDTGAAEFFFSGNLGMSDSFFRDRELFLTTGLRGCATDFAFALLGISTAKFASTRQDRAFRTSLEDVLQGELHDSRVLRTAASGRERSSWSDGIAEIGIVHRRYRVGEAHPVECVKCFDASFDAVPLVDVKDATERDVKRFVRRAIEGVPSQIADGT